MDELPIYYARLTTRIKAMLIDSIIFVLWILIVPAIVKSSNQDASATRMWLILSPIVIYETLMISIFACTIGQRLMGIRVLREDYSKVPLHISFIRWITKSLLGLYSFIYMFFTDKLQAIHDRIAGTVVIVNPKLVEASPKDRSQGRNQAYT